MSRVGQLLIDTITHSDPAIRDRSIRELVAGAEVGQILEACDALEQFRRSRQNLYEQVRATLFLHALYRFQIQDAEPLPATGLLPYSGFMDLMERRYEEA